LRARDINILSRWAANLDAFRTVPKDLAEVRQMEVAEVWPRYPKSMEKMMFLWNLMGL